MFSLDRRFSERTCGSLNSWTVVLNLGQSFPGVDLCCAELKKKHKLPESLNSGSVKCEC